jgi:hypothetical protein
MGHHWNAGYADTISAELLAKLVPDEYAAFMKAAGDTFEDDVRQDLESPEIRNEWNSLREAFKEKYNLELGVEYLDDCIDGDEEGIYWYISDAYVKNPALVKLEENLGRKVLDRVWQVSYA